ncbi:MAG: DoxX family protein [Chitinophagaceae bacterium]
MNSIIWICQILLAVMFLYSGICKSFYSEQQLIAKGQTGVVGQPVAVIRLAGISEVLGAVGIVLPWLLKVLPFLTPVSAIGFAVIMLFAAPIHYRLREKRNIAVNLTLMVTSLLVAWWRWRQL